MHTQIEILNKIKIKFLLNKTNLTKQWNSIKQKFLTLKLLKNKSIAHSNDSIKEEPQLKLDLIENMTKKIGEKYLKYFYLKLHHKDQEIQNIAQSNMYQDYTIRNEGLDQPKKVSKSLPKPLKSRFLSHDKDKFQHTSHNIIYTEQIPYSNFNVHSPKQSLSRERNLNKTLKKPDKIFDTNNNYNSFLNLDKLKKKKKTRADVKVILIKKNC